MSPSFPLNFSTNGQETEHQDKQQDQVAVFVELVHPIRDLPSAFSNRYQDELRVYRVI